jgi:hypothetical protein
MLTNDGEGVETRTHVQTACGIDRCERLCGRSPLIVSYLLRNMRHNVRFELA